MYDIIYTSSTASDTFPDSGPTCKKAVDFGDKHVFKSSAFEPTPEAVRNADLADDRAKDTQNHPASHPTATAMDIMELTDSSDDDDLPDFEELLQQSSSQKSQKSSSQKTVKRLESMKLEDDGFEMTGSPPAFAGSPSTFPLPCNLLTAGLKPRKTRASRLRRMMARRRS